MLGGGAWGTALAQVAAAEGEPVLLWAREPEVVDSINRDHRNALFLPNAELSSTIVAADELGALADAEALLVVAPAQHVRAVLGALDVGARPLVLCAKGIEAGTRKLVGEVAAELHPGASIAVLSGPTFAYEVAAGLPTAATLACADSGVRDVLIARLARPAFRLYASDDVTGAEIGGAVKNVLAIACGVVEGAGLGQNARAALIARGFAEMTRFGLARGARAETLAGLSGLGDLVLTATSPSSRNFSFGMELGRGVAQSDLLAPGRPLAEGVATAPALVSRARKEGVELPIAEAVADLLAGLPAGDALLRLMGRPLKEE